MCYSAQSWTNYQRYTRAYGARISFLEFIKLYGLRQIDPRIKIPKAMDAAFLDAPGSEGDREIKASIDAFNAHQTSALEQDLFKQRRRLADAERVLSTKTTKATAESKRIAGEKATRILGRLADLQRRQLKDRDSRIFPGYYVPVMIWQDGERVVMPMRYQCRPAGKPAFYDTKYPGTYNARRDNLQGFWKGQFGVSHGLMVVNRFFENVSRHRLEGRELEPGEKEENVVLEFSPEPAHDMLVACLWSRWQAPGEPDLLSFAAITDDPPPEVAAAGHDRCIVPIKAEYIDAWLNPGPGEFASLYAILDDRDRPYYEHRVAA